MTDRDDAFEVDQRDDSRRANDPNADERDDHPLGTVTGTGTGATVGAVAGMTFGGPVGAVVGGVVGGVAGGAVGHGAAEAVNPEGDQVSGDRIPDPGTGDGDDPVEPRG